MGRENFKKTKHKAPKFKELKDEDIDWEEKLEIQKLNKKTGKRSHQKKNNPDKW